MPLAGESTILVPIDVSGSEPPDRAILDLLESVDVVVLGYYPVPAQTAPAHLKGDHEDEAARRLDDVAAAFESAEHDVEQVLVFTKDRQDTIDRVAEEHGCDAVLLPGVDGTVERVLVPLRGDVNLERIVAFVGDLVAGSDASVTLFHSVPEGDDPSQGEFVLRGAADRLAEAGIDRDRLDWELSERGDPRAEIVARAHDHDLLVLGETKPSLRERIIGAVLTPILDDVDEHAIVVRDVD